MGCWDLFGALEEAIASLALTFGPAEGCLHLSGAAMGKARKLGHTASAAAALARADLVDALGLPQEPIPNRVEYGVLQIATVMITIVVTIWWHGRLVISGG